MKKSIQPPPGTPFDSQRPDEKVFKSIREDKTPREAKKGINNHNIQTYQGFHKGGSEEGEGSEHWVL